MRSGLLAVGVILLILGAIFYFVPGDTTTETRTVDTEVAQTYDSTLDMSDNETGNETDTWTTSDTETRTTVSDTTAVSGNDTQTVADPGDETIGDPDTTVYVYVDDDGAMYTPEGEYLGAGIGATAVSGTGVSDTTRTDITGTTADTEARGNTTTVSDTGAWDTGIDERQDVSDQEAAKTIEDRDTTLVGEETEDNATLAGTTAGADGGNVIRTLAILAMVLGAILTILGLVLPSHHVDVDVDRSARTQGAAGRRVYERDEIRRR